MQNEEHFGVCKVSVSGDKLALVMTKSQAGKLHDIIKTATTPKFANKTQFATETGLFKQALSWASRELSK